MTQWTVATVGRDDPDMLNPHVTMRVEHWHTCPVCHHSWSCGKTECALIAAHAAIATPCRIHRARPLPPPPPAPPDVPDAPVQETENPARAVDPVLARKRELWRKHSREYREWKKAHASQ